MATGGAAVAAGGGGGGGCVAAGCGAAAGADGGGAVGCGADDARLVAAAVKRAEVFCWIVLRTLSEGVTHLTSGSPLALRLAA